MNSSDAVAWPFVIGGDIAERWEWKTEGLAPRYGMEQTIQRRLAPRVVMQFDGLDSGDHRRWMETLLTMNGAGLWHAPLAMDTIETTAPVIAGGLSVPIPTEYLRFFDGGNALIVDQANPRKHQILEITDVLAGALTIADPLTDGWSAGSTVMPTIGAFLESTPVLNRFTGSDAVYSPGFRAAFPIDVAPSFGAATYRSLPVFELPIDWSTDPAFTPARAIEVSDGGTGLIALYDRAGMVMPSVRVDVTLTSRSAVAEFQALLYAMAGRRHPIWVPSYGLDIQLQSAAGSLLDVNWFGFSEWPIQSNRRDIRIERANAEPIYRRITAVAELDSDTERLGLDSDLPPGFDAGDVTSISFMALCRQEADTNLLRLWKRGVVLSQLTFKGCSHEL